MNPVHLEELVDVGNDDGDDQVGDGDRDEEHEGQEKQLEQPVAPPHRPALMGDCQHCYIYLHETAELGIVFMNVFNNEKRFKKINKNIYNILMIKSKIPNVPNSP